MKWFKHDSNASIDAKLKRVRLKYGMEGDRLYWYCLELIAQTVERHNLSFELEHDAELIAMDTGIHQERVQEMMSDLVKWGLFEDNHGVVTCLKMASRTDEYTLKLLRTNSRQTPDKIPPNRTDENRTEEKRVEKKKADFFLPAEVDESIWADYVQHRKEIHKPLTPLSKVKSANILKDLSHDQQRACVDKSISSRWAGLFPDKHAVKKSKSDAAMDEWLNESNTIDGECTHVKQ